MDKFVGWKSWVRFHFNSFVFGYSTNEYFWRKLPRFYFNIKSKFLQPFFAHLWLSSSFGSLFIKCVSAGYRALLRYVDFKIFSLLDIDTLLEFVSNWVKFRFLQKILWDKNLLHSRPRSACNLVFSVGA